MTYKELVDTLKDIAFRHHMIVDFGYGEISDIKVKSQDEVNNDEADYPYMFLNPGQHTRTQNSINYNFNLIMMDMAKDDDTNSDVLRIQSECQQYIDDVLSELYFEMNSILDVNLSVSLTPFKERFQDNVAGMTATLNIVVPQGLNRCIAPVLPIEELIVDVEALTSQDVGSDLGENKAFTFTTVYTNVNSQWDGINRFTSTNTQTLKVEARYSFQFIQAPGEAFPIAPQLLAITSEAGLQYIPATTTVGWPDTPQTGVTYNVVQVWDNLENVPGDIEFVYMNDQPGDEADLLVDAGATLKIYKFNS